MNELTGWDALPKLYQYKQWLIHNKYDIEMSQPIVERQYLHTRLHHEIINTESAINRLERHISLLCVGDVENLSMFAKSTYNKSTELKLISYEL